MPSSSSDGFNLGCALSFVNLERGVYVVMHGQYFFANEVQKNKTKGRFEGSNNKAPHILYLLFH